MRWLPAAVLADHPEGTGVQKRKTESLGRRPFFASR